MFTIQWQENIKLALDQLVNTVNEFEAELKLSKKMGKTKEAEHLNYFLGKSIVFFEESGEVIQNILSQFVSVENKNYEYLQKISFLQKQMCHLIREILFLDEES